MQKEIFIHLPLPYHNSDQLIRSLRSGSHFYASFDVSIPEPEAYRSKLARYLTSPEYRKVTETGRDAFWNRIGGRDARRTVLSLPRVPNAPHQIADPRGLLPELDKAVARILDLFCDREVTILIGIVNPGNLLATLIQSGASKGVITTELALGTVQFWSDVLGACIDEFPSLRIKVWKHEAAHLHWPCILRHVGRVPDARLVPGSLDMISHYVTDEGINSTIDHIRRLPPQNDYQFEKILHSNFVKHYDNKKASRRIRLKEWTPEVIEAFERIYKEDISIIRSDTNLTFIE